MLTNTHISCVSARGAVRCLVVLMLLVLMTSITACSWFGGGKKKDEEREKARSLTEKQLYEKVQVLLDDEDFELAVRNLQLLESRFPFGVYADQSQLDIAYRMISVTKSRKNPRLQAVIRQTLHIPRIVCIVMIRV